RRRFCASTPRSSAPAAQDLHLRATARRRFCASTPRSSAPVAQHLHLRATARRRFCAPTPRHSATPRKTCISGPRRPFQECAPQRGGVTRGLSRDLLLGENRVTACESPASRGGSGELLAVGPRLDRR